MARAPRKPREIKRAIDQIVETIGSPAVIRRVDPRQPDLFEVAFTPPAKPTLAHKVPTGARWQYEIKHDGYRAQCHVHQGQVRIYTKSGHDWSTRMPGIVADLETLVPHSAVIDGEACMVGADGKTDFFAIHAALASKSAPDAILYAFDLLYLDGEDLRVRPLIERRAMLAELLASAGPSIILSEHETENGQALLKAACDMGLEGIVAKQRDAPYRSGYVESWIKVKCTKTESFAVIGYEAVRGGVRSLRVAHLVDGALVPAGSVGSGLTHETARALWVALEAGRPVVIDVEFRGWTPAGELRHAVVKGWHGGE
jgi:bifunctional non-homologous end joining protein LigD